MSELDNFEIFDEDETLEYKLILIGDTSVGKTCLFKKLTSGKFFGKNVSTVGIDKRTLQVPHDFDENGTIVSKSVNINLTDTAGQERYQAITKSYYKGANGFILLYDITNKKSFDHLSNWIESIKNSINYESNEYVIFLLGTKLDIVEDNPNRREVTVESAQNKCTELGLEWSGECSSKNFSSEEFQKIIDNFLKKMYDKIGYRKNDRKTIKNLDVKKGKKKKKCGC